MQGLGRGFEMRILFWTILFLIVFPQLIIAQNMISSQKIQDVQITVTLNEDASIDYAEQIILVKNDADLSPLNITLPSGNIDGEILVEDLIEKLGLQRRYNQLTSNCSNSFFYDSVTNKIIICPSNNNEKVYSIKVKLLAPQCQTKELTERTKVLNNNVLITLPIQSQDSYSASIKVVGSEGVSVGDPKPSACTNSEREDIFESLRYPIYNGFVCQIKIKPSNISNEAQISIEHGAYYTKLSDRELQIKNLNASIRASEAVESTKLAPWLSLAVAALALAVAFFTYLVNRNLTKITKESSDTTREILEETRQENKPIVKAKLDPFGDRHFVIKIVNIGKSSAVDVEVNYRIHPNGKEQKWNHHLLQENDFVRIAPKEACPISLKHMDTFEKIIVKSSWMDAQGKSYSENYDINLKSYKKSIDENNWLYDTSLKDDIESISREIKKIAHTLEDKDIDIKVKEITLNPQKLESEVKLYKKLFSDKKKLIKNLQKDEPAKQKTERQFQPNNGDGKDT